MLYGLFSTKVNRMVAGNWPNKCIHLDNSLCTNDNCPSIEIEIRRKTLYLSVDNNSQNQNQTPYDKVRIFLYAMEELT